MRIKKKIYTYICICKHRIWNLVAFLLSFYIQYMLRQNYVNMPQMSIYYTYANKYNPLNQCLHMLVYLCAHTFFLIKPVFEPTTCFSLPTKTFQHFLFLKISNFLFFTFFFVWHCIAAAFLKLHNLQRLSFPCDFCLPHCLLSTHTHTHIYIIPVCLSTTLCKLQFPAALVI